MIKKLWATLLVVFTLCLSIGLVSCSKKNDESDNTPRIELSASELTLEVGQTALIKPVLKNSDGIILWQSSNSDIASVNQSGCVTANSIGSVVITAFVNQDLFNSLTVNVVKASESASITFPTNSYRMSRYENLKLTPTFVNCEGISKWTSSDPAVATVDEEGNVVPVNIGVTTVRVARADIYAEVTVYVEESSVVPTLSLNRNELSLLVGRELSIVPTVRYNGTVVNGFTVEMTSENEFIATVENGVVKGVSFGKTIITVSVSYRGYDFSEMKVPVSVLKDINIVLSSNEIELNTKEISGYNYRKSAQIDAEVFINGVKASDKSVQWKSESDDVAKVTNGLITAVQEGKTEITATYEENGEIYTAKAYVNVVLSVATATKREIDLSSTTNVNFDVVFDADENMNRLTVNGNTVGATAGELGITVAVSDLKQYYGDLNILVETNKAVYTFPSLLITKSISTMADLRSIVISGNTLGGYYTLKNDIIADSSDKDFQIIGEWSNQGKLGFIGTFDGRGYGIYNLNIHKSGLFNCIGAKGVVKNLALVNTTGLNYVLATECRGTIDNVFVTSATKSFLIQMSDNCSLQNSFAILSAENSNIVGTIFNSTCSIKNVYAYASGMIQYSAYSQAAEPTIFASTDVARIREELSFMNFETSGYDKSYWAAADGVPMFKTCEQSVNVMPVINLEDEYTIVKGKEIVISASGYAAISLKNAVDGVVLSNGVVTVSENATVTFIATGLWGKTSEKTVTFTISDGTVLDRTTKRLFDYEIGSESVTFDLPADISMVTKLSIGSSGYFGNGVSVNAGKITIEKSLFDQISSVYGDYNITLTDGTNFWEYTCSFVTKIISSYEDLNSIRTTGDTLDGYYVLGQSFVAGNETAMDKLIGMWSSDKSKGFIGILDGRGYSITGLKLKQKGLFGCMGQSIVRNLALIDVEIADNGPAVFVASDCQSTRFENVFVSSNAKAMFNCAYGNITVKNVVFVSSYADGGYLFDQGNNTNGSCSLENVILVGKSQFSYYGGTVAQNNTAVYESVAKMFEALSAGNLFEKWDGSFNYKEGAIYFGNVKVIENN